MRQKQTLTVMALPLSSKELKLPLFVFVLFCLFDCFIFVWLPDGFLMRERKKWYGFGWVGGEEDQGRRRGRETMI